MRPLPSRVLKRVGWLGLVVAVSAACGGSGGEAILVEPEPEEVAVVLDVIAEAGGADSFPTPGIPELLGLADAIPVPTAEPVAVPDPLYSHLPRIDQEPEQEDSDTGSSAETPTPEPTESPDGGEDTAVQEPTPEESQAPLPGPPPAAPGPGPAYEDPSEVLITASGRSFALYEIDDEGTSRGVTETTIAVGALASETLAGNPFRDGVCAGAEARFGQANHHQELSRAIDFRGCYDDTGQYEYSTAFASTFVRDEVFAVAPMASPTFFGHDVFTEERVLYVGDDRLPGFCGRTNPLGFGIWGAQGCPVLDARGYVTLVEPVLTAYQATRDEGSENQAITYVVTASPAGEAVAESRSFESELLGMGPLTTLELLPSAAEGIRTDWTSVAEEIMTTSPDVVFLDGPMLQGLPAQLRGSGFIGELVVVGVVDPLTVADLDQRLALAPVTVISPGLDLAATDSAGWVAIVGAAGAVGVNEDEIGLDFVEGYVAADLLVRAIEATPEPMTVERVANTINGGWWYPGIRGVACGNWWPASHYVVNPCVAVSRVDVFSPELVPVLGLVETAPQLQFDLVD